MAKQGQELIKQMLNDIRVNLREEFDRNFEQKSFFDKPWDTTKLKNNKGSLMMRSGNLRRSIKLEVSGDSVVFSSSLPYASIHNEGGTIAVTPKMKSFFWAMYYKAAGASSRSYVLKTGKHHLIVSSDSKDRMKKQAASSSQRAVRMNEEAAQWKALALMKVGQKIEIKQRQFIGDHPQVGKIVEEAMDKNMKELNEYMYQLLKQK